ncbi:ribosome biogenesis protein [Candidatus Woesearchaeota archaeon]|nr:ribosome biogenesis protein [Candidatus Woesearchaeota archaeon]
MTEILRCTSCHTFTMTPLCTCGGSAISVIPLKYAPGDKYASYRRTAKEAERKAQGVL